MTTTVTKESLAARIAELESGARSLKEDYTLAAYKMLLATMEAEPVAWIVQNKNTGEVEIDEPFAKATNPKYWTDSFPVYRHAQQPVVPDELKEAAADFLTVLDEYPEQLVPVNRNSAAVRALRSAMLAAAPQSHGSEPATVPDIDYSALRYENMEPCAICGKVSSHPEGWHYCHGKK